MSPIWEFHLIIPLCIYMCNTYISYPSCVRQQYQCSVVAFYYFFFHLQFFFFFCFSLSLYNSFPTRRYHERQTSMEIHSMHSRIILIGRATSFFFSPSFLCITNTRHRSSLLVAFSLFAHSFIALYSVCSCLFRIRLR